MPSKNDEVRGAAVFDDVFDHVNEFGRYQMLVYFASCLLIFPVALQIACLVFAMGTPNFHCSSAGNSTCFPNKCCENCTSYTFDGPFTSVVSEWNLICDRAHLAAIAQSVFLVGMLVGSLVFGTMSDTYGRKKTIFATCGIMASFAVGSSLANCLSLFVFLRFVVGASATGLMITQFVFIIELVGPSKRTFAGKVQDLYWVASGCLTALVAYFIRDWNYLILACSLPAFILYLFWSIFPESARWLVAYDRFKDAHDVLLKYGGKNKSIDSNALMETIKKVREEQRKRTQEEHATKCTPLDLLRTKKIRRRALIVFYIWFAISMSFYGFFLYVVNLEGSLYLNFFIMFLIDIPHTPMSWFLIHKFGRRVPFASFLLIGGGTCLLSLAVQDYPKAITAVSMIGKFFCSASFSTVYLYTTELFPTVIRNTAIGTCSMCARIGAITAPFIVMLIQLPGVTVTIPIVIIGIVTMTAGVLSLWLPETLDTKMHQTIAEAEAAPERFDIPCFKRAPSKPSFQDDDNELDMQTSP